VSRGGSAGSETLDPDKIFPFQLGGAGPLSPAAAGADGCCALASLSLQCRRRGLCWRPKDPPPLATRVQDLGGCEWLRLLECPAALGFLKPAVAVHCAGGEHFVLPLDACGEVAALRAELAQRLNPDGDEPPEGAAEALRLVSAEADGAETAVADGYLPGSTTLLCARPGEDLSAARSAWQRREKRLAEREAAAPRRWVSEDALSDGA